MTTSRSIYNALRIASLGVAVALFAFAVPNEIARLGPADGLVLAAAALIAAALSVLRAPIAFFERATRPAPTSDRIAFLMPLLAAMFVYYGWAEAAAVNVVAQLIVPRAARRRSPLERVLGAALRVPMWAVVAPLHDVLARLAAPLSGPAFGWYVLINLAWFFALNLIWLDVLTALKTGRSIWPSWSLHLRDARSLAMMTLELAWSYVAFQVLRRDGAELGLALFLPVVVIAALYVQVARVSSRAHRLTLSRDAVEAMLVASDPKPQIRSILESIDQRFAREAVEIFAFGRGGGEMSVAKLGVPPPPGLERYATRVLFELRTHETPVEGFRASEGGFVLAFAAHDEGNVLGALVVYRDAGAHGFVSARECERAANELAPLLRDYGAIAATRTAASIDTLTGLVNRRTVTRAVEDAMTYVRSGGTYAMLLLDVDHFKAINDLLGHQAGDRALARIGAILAESVRDGDIAGRFGGEEFIVIMRDADRERALSVAERLRSAIEASGIAYADGKPITISIGVTYARPGDVSSEAVIERADRALYRAKNTGRNRVIEAPFVAV
jgi:diguanylate cyclase (GGDEF)-like protein